MSPYPGVEIANRFFSGTGASYDRIVRLFTIGFDRCWKRRILDKIPPTSRHVIDQASGTGILTFKIARRFPSCHVTGVELRQEYLDIAKHKARKMKLNNVEFILGLAECVLIRGPVDCITSSYLAKYAQLGHLTRNAKAMLRQGGLLVVHDFTYPSGRLFPRLWRFYFTLLQTLGVRFCPEWQTALSELPEFLRRTHWIPDLIECLRKDGFVSIHIDSLTFGTSAIITATRA